jgi:hypothetical protein
MKKTRKWRKKYSVVKTKAKKYKKDNYKKDNYKKLKHKRLDDVILTKSLFPDRINRSNSVRTFSPPRVISRVAEKPSKLYTKLYSNPLSLNRKKLTCHEKKQYNDNVRRKKFFIAKASGASSARPEHIRKHKRC